MLKINFLKHQKSSEPISVIINLGWRKKTWKWILHNKTTLSGIRFVNWVGRKFGKSRSASFCDQNLNVISSCNVSAQLQSHFRSDKGAAFSAEPRTARNSTQVGQFSVVISDETAAVDRISVQVPSFLSASMYTLLVVSTTSDGYQHQPRFHGLLPIFHAAGLLVKCHTTSFSYLPAPSLKIQLGNPADVVLPSAHACISSSHSLAVTHACSPDVTRLSWLVT